MLFSRASFLGLVGASLLACVGDAPVANPGQDSGVDATNDTGTGKDSGVDSPADAPTEAGPAFDQTGLVLWLDAKTVSTTAGKVTSWPDQSGKGNDATQGNGGAQPGYATNVQNGLPGVSFTPGTFLEIPKGAGFDDFTTGLSVFVAVRPTAVSVQGNNPFLQLAPQGVPPLVDAIQFLRVAQTNVSFQRPESTGSINDILQGSVVVKDEFALYEVVLASGSATLYKNGTSINTQTPFGFPPKLARTMNRVGGSSTNSYDTVEGQFGELILFATGLSDPKRKAVESYLKTRWGL